MTGVEHARRLRASARCWRSPSACGPSCRSCAPGQSRPWPLVAAAFVVHPTTALWFGVWVGVALIAADRRLRPWLLAAGGRAASLAAWAIGWGPLSPQLVRMDEAWLGRADGQGLSVRHRLAGGHVGAWPRCMPPCPAAGVRRAPRAWAWRTRAKAAWSLGLARAGGDLRRDAALRRRARRAGGAVPGVAGVLDARHHGHASMRCGRWRTPGAGRAAAAATGTGARHAVAVRAHVLAAVRAARG